MYVAINSLNLRINTIEKRKCPIFDKFFDRTKHAKIFSVCEKILNTHVHILILTNLQKKTFQTLEI
jgi:hypothetical protein